ncbi:MAG: hypothetical protein P8R42_13555 [Candidatus Binatia bacterium]|nr:hypothetical protein [Candidatus Binatia bacterium]
MENGVCPHFDRQCTAYEGRPIECELFPHTMHRVIPMGMFVFVTYHHRVVCPIRSELFATDAAAREKITALIRNVYGPACRPVLINENADRFRVLRRAYFWLQCLAYPSTRFRVPLDHAG